MRKGGKSKLKIFVVTNPETNRNIEDILYKNIAKAIVNSEEFGKLLSLNKEQKEFALQ